MDKNKAHNNFSPIIWAFVVCFQYVSIIFNKLFLFVALRIYKNINFVNIPRLLSYQQQVVFLMSQLKKSYLSPFNNGLLYLFKTRLNFLIWQ